MHSSSSQSLAPFKSVSSRDVLNKETAHGRNISKELFIVYWSFFHSLIMQGVANIPPSIDPLAKPVKI